MRIAYITPGSGDNFYCQNCFYDDELLTSMLLQGHDVHKIPMYLPSGLNQSAIPGTPVFYGAVNLYLKEKLPFYRHAPNWIAKAFDSDAVLKFAAKKSGSTSPSGLEDMTLSMLYGEKGRQASELDTLIQYLKEKIKPDVAHLSNALLLGLAHRLKHDLGARVVCSLQDENEWIDEMDLAYQNSIWNLMGERAVDVDLFVTPSQYYAQRIQDELKLPADKIKVIKGGINLNGYQLSPLPFDPPVIGYLCRMSEYFGLGIVVDAFLELKKQNRFEGLKLHVTGGFTGIDKQFVNSVIDKVDRRGYREDLVIFKEFGKIERIKFLKTLTLLSVPVPTGEAFGAYQVEALAAGVPVVQPKVGGYPEFVGLTGGGIIYTPNDPETLAKNIALMLSDPDRLRRIGEQGRKAVLENYSIQDMAKNIVDMYSQLTGDPGKEE